MFYIIKENEIILADEDKQRLQNTLLLKPELDNPPILETDAQHTIFNFQLVTLAEKEALKEALDSQKKATEVRSVRDQYLSDTDKYMINDYPITDEDRAKYVAYRAYLRDVPENKSFPDVKVMSFNEFSGSI